MDRQAHTWRTWRQASAIVLAPRQLRRTVTLALIIGSVFVAMNQLNVILAGNGDTITWLKAALTYLSPLLVSNFGVLSASRAKPNPIAADGR
jgi:hypothetical protein